MTTGSLALIRSSFSLLTPSVLTSPFDRAPVGPVANTPAAAMMLENNAETPSPFITAKQLNSFLHKPVIVAGKVSTVSESTMTLDGGDAGKVNVVRSKPSKIMIESGMNVMVRGFVNQDLTVAESKTFSATDLGEGFGEL